MKKQVSRKESIKEQKNSDMFFYFYNFSGNGSFVIAATYGVIINVSYLLEGTYDWVILLSIPIWSTLFFIWLYYIKKKLYFEI